MSSLDPLTRLSPHFLLSDFLGNHSVYSKGLKNGLDEDDPYFTKKLGNLQALCDRALEPMLADYGPMSISYGFISPALSRRLVTYQDPDKPSHHRADLGAAADVCVHKWVEGCEGEDVSANAPATLAGQLIADDGASYPLSRLITYSESPYLCIAVSKEEASRFLPRLAIYENRYTGKPKVKPTFLRYNSPAARSKFVEETRRPEFLAEHGWRGKGYPTHHGGGMRQYHHRRVSKYTMVSDWLFDLQLIADGVRNNPKLCDERVLDAFAAAGTMYDWLIDATGLTRLSIVRGYLDPSIKNRGRAEDDVSDWSEPYIGFEFVPSAGTDLEVFSELQDTLGFPIDMTAREEGSEFVVTISFYVEHVLEQASIGCTTQGIQAVA